MSSTFRPFDVEMITTIVMMCKKDSIPRGDVSEAEMTFTSIMILELHLGFGLTSGDSLGDTRLIYVLAS